jgi:hypothetical protein
VIPIAIDLERVKTAQARRDELDVYGLSADRQVTIVEPEADGFAFVGDVDSSSQMESICRILDMFSSR